MTDAILNALRERLERDERKKSGAKGAREILREARLRFAKLPVLDSRSPDEILGYGEHGLPR